MSRKTQPNSRLTQPQQGEDNAQVHDAQPHPARNHALRDRLPPVGQGRSDAVRGSGPHRAAVADEVAANLQSYAGLRLTGLLITVATLQLYDSICAFAAFEIPSGLGTWLLVFVAFDFLFYWAHRLSHSNRWLWASHAVHHQGRFMNWSLAVRQSWTHAHLIWPIFLPLAVLGVPSTTLYSVAMVSSVYQLVIHTERVTRLPWPIEFLFSTPAHHRVHHHRSGRSCNHGAVFIIWDRLFGTFALETVPRQSEYGIEGGYVGTDAFLAQWAPVARVLGRPRPSGDRRRPHLGWAVVNLALALVARQALVETPLGVRLGVVAVLFASIALASRARRSRPLERQDERLGLTGIVTQRP